MHKESGKANGLTWDKLEKVWYKSMHMGLSAKSKFEDVRRCVVWAAMKLGFFDSEIAIIKAAFDEVGIKAQEANFGTIYGTVTEISPDKKYIKGVKVSVSEKSFDHGVLLSNVIKEYTTTPIGRYYFQLEAGNYHISFDKDGYMPESRDVSIKSSEDIKLDIKLRHIASASFTGIVLDISGDVPIEGVKVRISSGDSMTITTITNANGQYLFAPGEIDNGNYTIELSKEGYNTSSHDIVVNGTTSQDFYMTQIAASSISGVIRYSSDDVPIAGVTVTIISAKGIIKGKTTTNANGEYSFKLGNNEDGDYTIELSKYGYETSSFNVTIKNNVINKDAYMTAKSKEVEIIDENIPLDAKHFPDPYFRLSIKNFDVNKDNNLSSEEIQQVTKLFISGLAESAQGIEYFTAVQELHCTGTSLTSLDLSGFTALQKLYVGGSQYSKNALTMLDVSGCTALQVLDCTSNKLTTLNLNGCTALQYLYCSNNKLTSLDLSDCNLLQDLSCHMNQLTSLNLSNHLALQRILCMDNELTTLDVSNCTSLQVLSCGNNQLVSLQTLSCEECKLTTLDLSGFTNLQYLYCFKNQLMNLKLTGCTSLQKIRCYTNRLTNLDVSSCSSLNELRCSDNQLTELNISSNVTLTCDSYVTVHRYTSSINNANVVINDNYIIVAKLPEFQAEHEDEYSFDVSLDVEVPAGSTLNFVVSSEDLFGVFFDDDGEELKMPTTESLTHVRVSANFEAGKTYKPVITAQAQGDNDESSNGGCNEGLIGVISLLVILIMKRLRVIS